jgi:hypothetical protein
MSKSLVILIIQDFPIISNEMIEIADIRDRINEKAKLDMKELLTKHGK